ncbi:MAG: M14 family metallopeptidase [Thermoplasmatota archaeon]
MGSIGRSSIVMLFSAILLVSFPVPGTEGQEEWSPWTYHTSGEISLSLQQLALLNEEAEYTTAQDLLGTRDITGGRVVPILFIGNRSDLSRKWIMIIGAHHGDEPDSAETVLAFAHYILTASEDDVVSDHLLDSINIAVLPVVNPFGLDHNSRFDENGEDPNRDYPFDPEGATSHSDGVPLTTAGAHAVHSLARMYPFSMALSFHTGSEGVFTPWGAEDVESLTPDQNMFEDLGSVLSTASGRNLNHGPANEFGTLGYLRGAFDDHLYGSTFYSQHLPSTDLALPWSTATATIEMISAKGRDETRLGNLDGVFFVGGPNDGTVPMGIRMSISACQLLVPEVAGSVERSGTDCEVDLVFTGSSSPSVSKLELTAKGSDPAFRGLRVEKHPLLPEHYITGSVPLPEPDLQYVASLSISFDTDWNDLEDPSDPHIAPVSLLSVSRYSNTAIELRWELDGGSPGDRGEFLEIIDIVPRAQQAGGIARIILNIPPSLGQPYLMYIHTRIDWNVETTMVPPSNITTGTSSYLFLTPLMEGVAEIEVDLTTDNGNYRALSSIRLYPYVRITHVLRVFDRPDVYRVHVGVDAAIGPTPVFYGVSRSLDLEWGEEGWVIPPAGLVAPGYGPLSFEVDLSRVGGTVYLRLCNFPGAAETFEMIELDTALTVTHPETRTGSNLLIIGPSLIYMRWNGLTVLTPDDYQITYNVDIRNVRTNTNQQHELVWQGIDQMSYADRRALREIAAEIGIPEEGLKGGWIGTMAAPEEDGTYSIKPHAAGEIVAGRPYDLSGFDVELTAVNSFSVGDESEEDEGNDFPLSLVIFIIVLITAVFILSLLRRNAHIQKDDEEELPKAKGPVRRPPPPRPSPGSRREVQRSHPPWKGGGFK